MLSALLLVGALLTQGAAPAPPAVERLFGCPLDAPAPAWRAPSTWATVALAEVRASAAAPRRWTRRRAPGRVELAAPSAQVTLTVRRSAERGPGTLARLRRAVEAAELGPSHAGPRCAQALARRVAAETGLRDVSVGVYGRPLADRRRSWAVFARDGGGPLVAVVTQRWSRRASGPDLGRVRQLLGGLRAAPAPE